MSRTLSAGAVAQLTRQHSSECYLVLLTISGPGITTLRVVNNTENVTSGGNTFTAFPFKVEFPPDLTEELRPARLIFSNVDLRLIDEIRSVEELNCAVSVITASSPNTIELGPLDFRLTFAEWDEDNISATLDVKSGYRSAFPGLRFDPQLFPQMFGVLNAA